MLRYRFAFIAAAAFAFASTPAWTAPAPPTASGHATRIDPYKNFRFRVEMGGRTVAGVNKVSMPPMRAVVEHRGGGDPSTSHKSPGRSKFEAITLERGLTQDLDFARWASSGAGPRGAGAPVTRELSIVMVDEQGRPAIVWRVHRAWVSEYVANADLDANAAAVEIQHIKLENEGWER